MKNYLKKVNYIKKQATFLIVALFSFSFTFK